MLYRPLPLSWIQKTTLLHPTRIKATASGGINGIAILPMSELDKRKLNYPLGIADIKELTGKQIKLKAFRRLPKLLYMGETDTNDAVAFEDA